MAMIWERSAQNKTYKGFQMRADPKNDTLRVLTTESETLGELHPQFLA